jgi:hypothetical protein
MACNGRPERQGEEYEAPDLLTQLEDLLDQVWRSEADWQFNDRLDLALHGLPSAVRQEGLVDRTLADFDKGGRQS